MLLRCRRWSSVSMGPAYFRIAPFQPGRSFASKGAVHDVHRSNSYLPRLRRPVHFHGTRTGVPDGAPVDRCTQPLPRMPRPPACHAGGVSLSRHPTQHRRSAMTRKRQGLDESIPVTELPRSPARPQDFRVYCFSCGRSTSVSSPPRRPGRCLTCGGTMAIEMETA